MDATILATLLRDEHVGWVGWLVIITVVVGFGIGMLTKSIATIIKNVKALKKELDKPDYKKHIKCENNISQVMRVIRHDLLADRVLVIQYHNGVCSIARNSLLKMSVTHESLNRGIKSGMQTFQNIPSNYFGNWNKEIFDSRYVEIPNINAEEADIEPEQRGAVQFLNEVGVKSMYLFPLEDSMGVTFGMGVVQYMHKNHELSTSDLQWVRNRFHGIGSLLAGPGNKKE